MCVLVCVYLCRQALTAAFLAPDAHVPDTPARKARRLMRQRLVLAGVTAAALGLGGYCLYSFLHADEHGSGSSGGSGTSSTFASRPGGGKAGGGGGGSGLRAGGGGGGSGSGGGEGNALKGLFGVSSLGDKVSALFS